jgi:archaellum component FlaF (FlaF/FlaG flagellin family)
MDYLRDHVKRYWGMAYRRTLGISLITAALVMAVGLTFNILTHNITNASYLTFLVFWTVLVLIALFVALSNLFNAHVSSVKLMQEAEYEVNTRRIALWMITIVVGSLALLSPLLFIASYLQPIVVLAAFGGIFLVLYISLVLIFKNSYKELIIGAVAYLFMVIFGLSQLHGTLFNISTLANFNLYFAVMSIMIISSFTGLAMLFNSTNESNVEFMKMVKRVESNEIISQLNKEQIDALISSNILIKKKDNYMLMTTAHPSRHKKTNPTKKIKANKKNT